MTRSYIDALVAAYPAITEIWLIGSRANDRAGSQSDWDYLVFASDDVYPPLTTDTRFHTESIDLLVVRPGGSKFCKPWAEPDRSVKKGDLNDPEGGGWEWKVVSSDRAQYRSDTGVTDNPATWGKGALETAVLVYRRT